MYKQFLGILSVTSFLVSGCALQPGDEDDHASSTDQPLTEVVLFKGQGNAGFSNSRNRTATIAADSQANASAQGSITISLPIDDSTRPRAGTVTTAQCGQRTITLTYSQADTGTFTVTGPRGQVARGRCATGVLLEWSTARPAGTRRILAETGAPTRRVQLSGMPITPAVGNVTVETRANGVVVTDPFTFRVDPARR